MRRMANGEPYPTMGPRVGRWIERNLVHGEGDHLGEPVRLRLFQWYILARLYEYDPDTGRLLYNRALIGMGKGNSKTELAAHIALAELAGPIAPLKSPRVVIAAASFKQANELFAAASLAITEGPLAPEFDVQDVKIFPHHRPGVLERIAAAGGRNDGGKPTAFLGDEKHEWEGENRERNETVQGKSLRKRRVPRAGGVSGSINVGITTAGDDKDSLLGRQYEHGRKVARGELEDPSFLFLWWEAHPSRDLDDPDDLLQAVLEGNPAAGDFLDIEGPLESFRDQLTPRHEAERYNTNRWVTSPKAWLSEHQWEQRKAASLPNGHPEHPGWPARGTKIVIGGDGSYNRDTTGLVGWTVDDYGFVIGLWEPQNGEPVVSSEVDAALHAAIEWFDVVELAFDPPGWRHEVEAWEAEFGERTVDAHDRTKGSGLVLRFETNQPSLMGPACDRFKSGVVTAESTLRHDGHPSLARHVKNCHTRDTRYGHLIVKDHKDSPRKIDLAVAAVIARQRALNQPKPRRRTVGAASF